MTDTKREAPERIWAWSDVVVNGWIEAPDNVLPVPETEIPYVRADLYEAERAKVEELEGQRIAWCDQAKSMGDEMESLRAKVEQLEREYRQADDAAAINAIAARSARAEALEALPCYWQEAHGWKSSCNEGAYLPPSETCPRCAAIRAAKEER